MLSRRFGIAVVVILCGWICRAQAEEPALLKYKLTKGDTAYYKNSQEMKQTQTINGMNIENSMKQEAILSQTVDDVAGGKTMLKVKAERRKFTAEFFGAGKFEFDSKSSERDTGSAVGGALTPILERLTGSEYQVAIDDRGQVVEVKGYGELIADLVKDNPLASQFGSADNKSAALNEQDYFIVLSDKPVKTGDSWEVPIEIEAAGLGAFKGKTTYTCQGPDKVGDRKTIRIAMASEMSVELKLDMAGTKVTGTLSTSNSSGTAQFDPEAGRVVSIKRGVAFSGQLSVDAGGMTLVIDNKQEHNSNLELLDKLPQD